jgi:uncharacterized protein YdeI (YjbR/CyaY-like superfamily)
MTTKIKSFKTQQDFRKWLTKNHDTSEGLWLRFYKKASGIKSINYQEALEEALCFGWIDSQVKGFDEKSYIQKFTPRRSKSQWSKINRQKVLKLIKENKMMPAGLKQILMAKKDGRWAKAYGSPATMKAPLDFLKALKKNKKAWEFYKTLNKSNVFAVSYQLHSAKKEETRIRRIQKFISMFAKGEKLY